MQTTLVWIYLAHFLLLLCETVGYCGTCPLLLMCQTTGTNPLSIQRSDIQEHECKKDLYCSLITKLIQSFEKITGMPICYLLAPFPSKRSLNKVEGRKWKVEFYWKLTGLSVCFLEFLQKQRSSSRYLKSSFAVQQ